MIEREEDRNEMYQRAAARIEQRSAPVETPERTPQRESSGQFSPAERPTGREAEERAAGFKPLKEDRDEPEGLTVRDAANDLAKERQTKPIEIHESGLDEKVTLSVEQAAKRIEDSREAEAAQAEMDGTAAAQKAVDDLRGEQPAEVRQPHQFEAEPDIEKVLAHPKIAKALQERVTEVETQRQHFETSIMEVGKMRIAELASFAPELSNVPLDKWVGAIVAMSKTDLPRAQQITAKLNSLAQVEAAVIQLEIAESGAHESGIRPILSARDPTLQRIDQGIYEGRNFRSTGRSTCDDERVRRGKSASIFGSDSGFDIPARFGRTDYGRRRKI